MSLRPDEALAYRGYIQPDRWKLHPDDFRARMDWEYSRKRVLDAQAAAIKDGLPEPVERVPPIPVLRYPGYDPVTEVVTEVKTVTKKPQSAVTPVTETPEDRKRRKNREKQARFKAKHRG